MILYGFIKKYSFLLMGDSSVKSEEVLLSKYNISNVDILKVGHHGSKTSSSREFIDSITPKYSLISAGFDNKFGHPNKEVLDILSNSTIYRTDLVGSVKVEFKNNKFNIKIND
jgi:competence protein ComEC